jgi:hypothetical protein
MASKKTAAILTIVGGVFYILGGVVLAGLVELLNSASGLSSLGLGGSGSTNICDLFGAGDFCGPNSNTTLTGSGIFGGSGGLDLGGVANIILAIGIVAGGVIIFGGWLINSESSTRRKVGCILAIIMILIGGLTTFGGLIIGFILAAIGVYLGLTYKSNSRGMVIPLGPMASVTLGPQTIPAPAHSNVPAGSGPLNYCIKCGSPIREGAVFCGACGTRLTD